MNRRKIKALKKIAAIVSVVVMSCGCTYEVENSNLFEVADAIHYSFENSDFQTLESIYKDSLSFWIDWEKGRREKIRDLFTNNPEYLKTDTSSFFLLEQGYQAKLYYSIKDEYYSIVANCTRDSITKLYKVYSLSVNNINEKCNSYLETPYCPKFSVDIKRILWTTSHSGKSFQSGSVELQNNLDQDINYIKLKVILKHGKNTWNKETFLNQTIESHEHIYKGDIVKIDIPKMTDYYAGFEIKENELTFTSELIEVRPKPESPWCKTLENVKQISNNGKN